MRKSLKVLLLGLCLVLVTSSAFAKSSIKKSDKPVHTYLSGTALQHELTKKEIAQFKSIGFTDRDIETMTQEEYEKFKGFEGKLVSKQGKYLHYKKVSEDEVIVEEVSAQEATKQIEEYNNKKLDKIKTASEDVSILGGVIDSDSVNESWLYLETTVYESDFGTKEFALRTDFEWKTTPIWKLTDIILTSTSDDLVAVQDSEIAKLYTDVYHYTSYDSLLASYSKTLTDAHFKQPDGQGMGFKLDIQDYDYAGDNTKVELYSGYMIFRTRCQNSTYTGWLSCGGNYAHQKLVGSYSINWGVPSVTPTSVYDNSDPTYVDWKEW